MSNTRDDEFLNAVHAAVPEAIRDARRMHKALGNPIYVSDDGHIREIPPNEIDTENLYPPSRPESQVK